MIQITQRKVVEEGENQGREYQESESEYQDRVSRESVKRPRESVSRESIKGGCQERQSIRREFGSRNRYMDLLLGPLLVATPVAP